MSPETVGHEPMITRTFTLGQMSARARFYSKCSCGWTGPIRQQTKTETAEQTGQRAEADFLKHSKGAK